MSKQKKYERRRVFAAVCAILLGAFVFVLIGCQKVPDEPHSYTQLDAGNADTTPVIAPEESEVDAEQAEEQEKQELIAQLDQLTGEARILAEQNDWLCDKVVSGMLADAAALITQAKEESASDDWQKTAQQMLAQIEQKLPELQSRRPPVIEVIDGVTYVEGVLIVNKSYTVPQEFGDGITTETQQAFDTMQAAATLDGVSLFICSGFRSYSYQASLYSNYVARDGMAAADTYSARPGHSEHQTGLALDINSTDGSMATSAEGLWLAEHCAEYGFIIRYPKGKEAITGYMYEPWHIRYVGVELAKQLTDNGLTLEEHFGLTSVYPEN